MSSWKIILFLLSFFCSGAGLSLAKGGSSGAGHSSGSSGSHAHSSSSSTSHASSSKASFGSFGSNKSAVPANAPAPANTPAPSQASSNTQGKSSFGSFSAPKEKYAPPVDSKPTSALSQNLDKTAAQNKALKTWDAGHEGEKSTNSSNKTGEPPTVAPLGSATPGAPGQGTVPPPAQPTVIYSNNSGSGNFSSGLLGFFLGRSLQHDQVVYPASPVPGTVMGKEAQQPSTGISWAAVFFWLVLLVLFGSILWYFLRSSRVKAENATKTHYSLRKDS